MYMYIYIYICVYGMMQVMILMRQTVQRAEVTFPAGLTELAYLNCLRTLSNVHAMAMFHQRSYISVIYIIVLIISVYMCWCVGAFLWVLVNWHIHACIRAQGHSQTRCHVGFM